jgi:chemotaxis protein MotB
MNNEGAREIVIVRKRHADDDEDHHGGVWKLAFADFMTAMMAFFLVMWLINSTTKETRATIVQYFNPVQLVDANPAHKGLRDPVDVGHGKGMPRSDARAKVSPSPSDAKEKNETLREAALFSNPMATLDEIAGAPAVADPTLAAPPSSPRNETPAFGDPFDRAARSPRPPSERDEEGGKAAEKPSEIDRADEAALLRRADQPVPSTPSSKPITPQQRIVASSSEERTRSDAATVASMRLEVEKILKLEGAGRRNLPHVEVTETEEGLLINLTDDANFSMFAVGSVEPKPQLVRILAHIGHILAERPGQIELRGHTDARSYKSAAYDNWRLSSDRANMAFYMLVRGGLAEKRVEKISGYADHRLKTPKEPLAANNRRIEILIRRDEH